MQWTLSLIVLACFALSSCNSGKSDKASLEVASSSAADNGGDLQIVNRLPPPDNTGDGKDVPIASGDILEIDVFQVDDLDKTVQVDSAGRVSMPLIGSIQAAGKTVAGFENELESKYGVNYLQSPDITVFVKESAGQRVTLDGQFLQPGVYSAGERATLVQMVALAKGLTDLADEEKIYVYRDVGGRKLVANLNLQDIRSGKSSDPKIYGGDVIVAFTSDQKVASKNLREALGIAVSATRVVSPL